MYPSTSSGLQSASAVIFTSGRECKLHAITLIQAAAAATLIIYDNASAASGTVVAQLNTTINVDSKTIVFQQPIACSKGIYAALTGSGAGYIVHFSA